MKFVTEITLMKEELDDIIRKYFGDEYDVNKISYEIGIENTSTGDPRDIGFSGRPVLKSVKLFTKDVI